jgi:DNA-binding MarR family transcriptional regulator
MTSPAPPDPSDESAFRRALERAKRASPAQLLFRCARRVDELALERVSRQARIALRPAHTALFPHIALDGTRQTELAQRLGVSKQAIHQLVSELVEFGVLERAPDPTDRRAALVRFTRKKGRSLLDGLVLLGEIERELEQAIGTRRMHALHDALARIDAHLDTQLAAGQDPAPAASQQPVPEPARHASPEPPAGAPPHAKLDAKTRPHQRTRRP